MQNDLSFPGAATQSSRTMIFRPQKKNDLFHSTEIGSLPAMTYETWTKGLKQGIV